MESLSPVWIWAIVGLVLLGTEIVTTTFFLLFFGTAALIVSVCVHFLNWGLPTQLATFAILGSIGVFALRKSLQASLAPSQDYSADSGKTIRLTQNIAAQDSASVSYQGTVWTALNTSSKNLIAGETAVILRIEGTKLIIAPQTSSS